MYEHFFNILYTYTLDTGCAGFTEGLEMRVKIIQFLLAIVIGFVALFFAFAFWALSGGAL